MIAEEEVIRGSDKEAAAETKTASSCRCSAEIKMAPPRMPGVLLQALFVFSLVSPYLECLSEYITDIEFRSRKTIFGSSYVLVTICTFKLLFK